MIVLALAHPFDAQRLPGEILARAPAALPTRHAAKLARFRLRPYAPGMMLEGVLAKRRDLCLTGAGGRGRGGACAGWPATRGTPAPLICGSHCNAVARSRVMGVR